MILSLVANNNLSAVFGALSDPTRFAVIERLAGGPASVSELQAPFPIATPTFLRHLRVLEKAGLVDTIKRGRVRTCSLRRDTLGMAEHWLHLRRTAVEAQLDRLETLLDEED